MKISSEEFLAQPKKAITLMGMSGLGKTYLSSMLGESGWTHYSCDEVIGTAFLAKEMTSPVTYDNLAPLSAFIGKIGNPAQGGLSLDEFLRRQKLYYNAECEALRRVGQAIMGSDADFVNDSTGSLCEITDEALIDTVGSQSLFVYIKASPEEEIRILQRAALTPKPLFFPPAHFERWLQDFMKQRYLTRIEEISPDEFAQWVFPILFRSRLPKYQALADRYGVTVPSETMQGVDTEADFLIRVVEAMAA